MVQRLVATLMFIPKAKLSDKSFAKITRKVLETYKMPQQHYKPYNRRWGMYCIFIFTSESELTSRPSQFILFSISTANSVIFCNCFVSHEPVTWLEIKLPHLYSIYVRVSNFVLLINRRTGDQFRYSSWKKLKERKEKNNLYNLW